MERKIYRYVLGKNGGRENSEKTPNTEIALKKGIEKNFLTGGGVKEIFSLLVKSGKEDLV